MSLQPPLEQLTKKDLIESYKQLEEKINALATALENEKKAVVRTKLIAKINSFCPDFKDDEKWSPDFLEGVAHGLSLQKPKIPPAPKENGGILPPTGESDELVYTPEGYKKKSEAIGLAKREDRAPKESVM